MKTNLLAVRGIQAQMVGAQILGDVVMVMTALGNSIVITAPTKDGAIEIFEALHFDTYEGGITTNSIEFEFEFYIGVSRI